MWSIPNYLKRHPPPVYFPSNKFRYINIIYSEYKPIVRFARFLIGLT